MATASVSITPECSRCRECLKTLKILPCGHTYCMDCLEKYIGDEIETFHCPRSDCLQVIKIPDGGAKMFTTNIIDTTSLTTQVTGTTSLTTQVTGTTSLHTSNSYQFLFNINDITKYGNLYYSKDKFSNNNVVWSCSVARYDGGTIGIYIRLLLDDNPKLDYCTIDCQISLLDIDDDSKTITHTNRKKKFVPYLGYWWWYGVNWPKLTDKNNGYLNSDGQFVLEFNIIQFREISWK